MKKLLIAFFTIFSLFLGGCLKDSPNVDFSNIVPHAEFEYPGGASNNGLGSGMEFFGGGTFTFPPTDDVDTVFFMVNIAAPNPPTSATTVTIAVDPSITAAYNADPNNDVKFENMPDSTYKLLNTTVTIAAGKYLDTFWMEVYPSKIDPTKSYMAPVKIADAGSTAISTNFSTIFFHTIGNPIAGPYFRDFTRWNATDSTGTNSGHTVTPQLFLPDDPTTVEVSTGYFTQPRYVITFEYDGTTVSNITVTFNADDIAYMHDNGVDVANGPNIIVADPVHANYEFQWQAKVLAGGDRYIIDKFHK